MCEVQCGNQGVSSLSYLQNRNDDKKILLLSWFISLVISVVKGGHKVFAFKTF